MLLIDFNKLYKLQLKVVLDFEMKASRYENVLKFFNLDEVAKKSWNFLNESAKGVSVFAHACVCAN